MKQLKMKELAVTILIVLINLYDLQSQEEKMKPLNHELIVVSDSISKLMSEYLYNPNELSNIEFRDLEKKVIDLAKSVETKQEYMIGFNEFWADGPFSHVNLTLTDLSANEMAAFLDTMRVGEQAVSLEWINKTAILTVNTMMGIDTKERISEVYHEIATNETVALIIDLRNNTGGTFAGIPLVGHVLRDTIDAGFFVSRKWWEHSVEEPTFKDVQNTLSWEGWSLRTFWNDIQQVPLTPIQFKPMQPHFDGQVYVLISNKSASATEFTVDAFAHEEKVTIIGQTSAGEMLSQKMFDLPCGFQLSLPIAEYYSTRIGRIEGKGIEPDIAIDDRVAMDAALMLIGGYTLKEAVRESEQKVNMSNEQIPDEEALFLFGSMNDWGKNWSVTPQFEFKGKGVYETKAKLRKGSHEFKIAPMNWDFDFGAVADQEEVVPTQKTTVVREPGSKNLKINIEKETRLRFRLDTSDEKDVTLIVLKE